MGRAVVRNQRMNETEGEGEGEEGLKHNIRQAIELSSSLISLSRSIRVFTVRWTLIRKKLEDLLSDLGAIESCNSNLTPSLSCFASSVLSTVNDCGDLAKRCVDLSYGGKLLMQNNLDLISQRLDEHAEYLSEIYSAGILRHGLAFVVSKPSADAGKDDVRLYIGEMSKIMRFGDNEQKRLALKSLHEAATEDGKYISVIAETGDVVSVLVDFVASPKLVLQEEATKIVSLFSGFDPNKLLLIQTGVVGPLVRVLEHGNESGREEAARCLTKLTENSDNAWSVSANGGVTALLKLCSSREARGELIACACGVLKNLVGVQEIKRFVIEGGAIPAFIDLAGSKDETIQANAIDFLGCIARDDEETRRTVVAKGGIGPLMRVLDPSSSFSWKSKEIALRTIGHLCFSSIDEVTFLITSGFLHHLLHLLRNAKSSLRISALKVTLELCDASDEVKRAMGEAGFMPELVRLLDAKSLDDVHKLACEAFHSLISVPKNRRAFAQDSHSIDFVLQMLDPKRGKSWGCENLLLSILMRLTSCRSARSAIQASGHLKNIEKLAEGEVSDAKRLVKRLSASRFRCMLSGIWHP